MKNPQPSLLWSANATSSTAFSTGNEPKAVSEQSEIAFAFFTTPFQFKGLNHLPGCASLNRHRTKLSRSPYARDSVGSSRDAHYDQPSGPFPPVSLAWF
ncbi:unnamed protein product [Cochlearia groenlandica]